MSHRNVFDMTRCKYGVISLEKCVLYLDLVTTKKPKTCATDCSCLHFAIHVVRLVRTNVNECYLLNFTWRSQEYSTSFPVWSVPWHVYKPLFLHVKRRIVNDLPETNLLPSFIFAQFFKNETCAELIGQVNVTFSYKGIILKSDMFRPKSENMK